MKPDTVVRAVVTLLLAWAAACATSAVRAQTGGGTLNFDNRVPISGIDAPIAFANGDRIYGDQGWVQLYAGPDAAALAPVGVPIHFRTGTAVGYFRGGVVTLTNVGPDQPCTAVVRAWAANAGASWEAARAGAGEFGESLLVRVVTGGAGSPPTVPGDLVGLAPFRLSVGVRIERGPVGGVFYVAQPVRLTVEAQAEGAPVSYGWEREGVAIPGATNAVLELDSSTPAVGRYRVAVTGGARTVTSAEVVVTILPVPPGACLHFSNRLPPGSTNAAAYVLESDGVTRLAGGGYVAQLYAGLAATNLVPVGAPVPMGVGADAGYWEAGAEPWRLIEGVAPGTLVWAQVRVWDASSGATFEACRAAGGRLGLSRVFQVATGGPGAATPHPAPLDVGLASFQVGWLPSIAVQPVGLALTVGDAGSLTVQAVSDVPLTYRWFRDGLVLGSATGRTLELGPMRLTDAGDYTVQVSSERGSVTSAVARVTVVPAPGLVYFNNLVAGSVDAPVFDVDGTTRLAGAGYVAQLYAGAIADGLRAVGPVVGFKTGARAGYIQPAMNGTVVLAGVAAGDPVFVQMRAWEAAAGWTFEDARAAGGKHGASKVFTVLAGGAGEPPSFPADLVGLESFRLEQGPVFVQQPKSVWAYVGQSVQFTAEVWSATPVSYQWSFEGTPIPWATNWLVLDAVQPAQAGRYRLSVANASGARDSAEARLTILPVPTSASVFFGNRVPAMGLDAPVFDLDGTNRIAGTNFVAQLFGGLTAETLAPLGDPVPFGTGPDAGYWGLDTDLSRALAGVAPGTTVYVQVRVWARAQGETLEQAREAGGRVGWSEVLEVVTGGQGAASLWPTALVGLKPIVMRAAPIFLAEPAHQTVARGKTAQFVGRVSSFQPVTYQWRREGVDIPGATNEVLELRDVQPAQQGLYVLIARNDTAARASQGATLSVTLLPSGGTIAFANRTTVPALDAPVFDTNGTTRLPGVRYRVQLYVGTQPNNLAAVAGTRGFQSGADAGYWTPGDAALNNFGPGVPVFVQVRAWDQTWGNSYESARAAGGAVGASAVLALVTGGYGEPETPPAPLLGLESFSIGLPPVLLQLPRSAVAYVGGTARFEVATSGSTPMSYQWFRNAIPLEGATNAVLTLTDLTVAQAGAYAVTVANAVGSASSPGASLTLVPELPAGALVHFSNRVPEAGLDAPVFDEFGNAPVDGARFVAQLLAGPSVQELRPVGATVPFLGGMEAGYWAVGTNSWRLIPGLAAGDRTWVQVQVWEGPEHPTLAQAAAVANRVGWSAPFEIVTGGAGAASALPAPLTGLERFTLVRRPVFLSQPGNLAVGRGAQANLSVSVRSSTPVAVQWWFNDQPLAGATDSVLQFLSVQASHAGTYRVVASNLVGTVSSAPAQLTVLPYWSGPGGVVKFSNWPADLGGAGAPVFAENGLTPLAGGAWRAQLYAGDQPDQLEPTGEPLGFLAGANAGFLSVSGSLLRAVPHVGSGGTASLQVRVWDSSVGATYEDTLALGGHVGTSAILQLATGTAAHPAPLTGLTSFAVARGPVFLEAPRGGVFFVGESALLRTALRSGLQAVLGWSFNGRAVPGATSTNLTLLDLQLADSGTYTATAQVGAMLHISAPAEVTVVPAPAGASVRFSNRVPLAGLDAPLFDFDGRPLAGEAFAAQLYAGATANVLVPVGEAVSFGTGPEAGYWWADAQPARVIEGVAPGALAYVQVRVWQRERGATFEEAQAARGRLGASAVLPVVTGGPGAPTPYPAPLAGLTSFRLLGPPHLLAQPTPQTLALGQPLTLEVQVSSAPPATYRWQLNGADLPGATNATYAVTTFQVADAGVYQVLVANEFGVVTSHPALVRVQSSASAATVNFSNRIVADHLDAPIRDAAGRPLEGDAWWAQLYGGPTLDALVPCGVPVHFRTGAGAGYVNGGQVEVPGVAGGAPAFVQIRVWETAGGPSYEGAAFAGVGHGVSAIVQIPTGNQNALPPTTPTNLIGLSGFETGSIPTLVEQPLGAVVLVGETLELRGAATGPPPLTYEWWRDGQPIPGATSAHLVLVDVGLADSGHYTFVARNGYGRAASAPASVVVRRAPEGATVLFSNRVPAAGVEAPVYDLATLQWLTGTNFAAQLVAGLTPTNLVPVGLTAAFGTGHEAGAWLAWPEPWRVIPAVAPGANVFCQVLVWERAFGATYDESRARGGRVGTSAAIEVTTGGAGVPATPPAPLRGLMGFAVDRAPIILVQPQDLLAATNQMVLFTVGVVSGSGAEYQWRFNGTNLPGAQGSTLVLSNVASLHVGEYSVAVANRVGTTLSAGAWLSLATNAAPGEVNFNNRVAGAGIDGRVVDASGVPCAGEAFNAQLYAGTSRERLAPTGVPVPFRTGAAAGYIDGGAVAVPAAPVGSVMFVQLRVWETAFGGAYEPSFLAGGQVGESEILSLIVSAPGGTPVNLVGLQSMRLRRGQVQPLILREPQDLPSIPPGFRVTFEIGVNHAYQATVRWQREDARGVWVEVPGADTRAFAIAQVGLSDYGRYRAVVTQGTNEVVSRVVTLGVGEAMGLGGTPGEIAMTMPPGSGPDYLIEASSDLATWETLGTTTSATPSFTFLDDTATNYFARFYRARALPGLTNLSAAIAGFVRVAVPRGISLIANPLDAGDNRVGALLAGVPAGTILYTYRPAGYSGWRLNAFEFGQWDDPDQVLAPGEGGYLRVPGPYNLTVTFRGTVPRGPSRVALPAGWSIRAAPVPGGGRLDTALGCPLSPGEVVVRFQSLEFLPHRYLGGVWEGGDVPELQLGEAFWIHKVVPAMWERPAP